ncbi:SusC/RagA family TonB-linked outer membrane protein [Maribacter hydrothermalis]|uniref:SusC/RagA family TonB-linked outer membrane protein n=1 Tax=Maribacter hydrothermalis TaxID=1836467 RepID=A0A1B7ZFA8_9FLAO|nr:TonB-dependent receptor [Maribacter hydrothermalis]APQ17772.1 SusC/RagA family TonB-linked outer membrane protein [Maribacter hydrothermalis]OBR42246.1 SusC/RagA family TonB-linked outer membrane protein [Maribacter hydrothermalis]
MKLKLLLLLMVIVPIGLMAQGQITGTVTSSDDGYPLPGTSVIIKGTTTGTTTDFDGNYELENVADNAILVFSYIGFTRMEVSVNGQSQINIALQEDAQQLDEVVLTGYSTERKVDLTGAVTVVDIAPIEGQSLSSGNAMQALQGRVGGLFIEKSGDPTGLSSRILIRGLTTLGNNDPLYVIDGVPTKRQEVFASLNPATIESIQVLKDASASSIYGSRAANGVIVVSTKGGLKGERLTVSINSNLSTQSERNQRYDMLSSQQRGEALWRASVNDGADPNAGYGEIYNFDWNNDFTNPSLNSVAVQPFVGGDPNVPAGNTDWQDELYETGYVFNNEVTVSTGTEKSSLLINLGYLKNTGMLKYTGYDRYTAKINGTTNLFNDRVKFGVNTQISTSNETLVSSDVGGAATTGLSITLAPTIPVYDANGEFAGPLGAGYSDRNNPLLMQFLNRWDNATKNNFFGNVFAEISILDNLKFRSSLGIDFSDFKRKNIEPKVFNGFVTRSNNRLIFDTNKLRTLTFSNTLNYNLDFGKHRFGALLGIESIREDFDTIFVQADDFAVEQESYFVLSAATGARTNNGISTQYSLASQFGKLNYAYDDKYLASFTIRRDGSSRFGANNRYGVFPAATLGWRISQEEFLKDSELISNLKLRAGYGEVGNQEIGNTARFGLYESRYGQNQAQLTGGFFEIYYNVGTAYDINGNNTGTLPSGFVSTQAPNPNLKWETTKEWNYGIDFGFLNNKISGSFDYFTRETTDILTTPPIASVIGEGQQRVLNGAATAAKGWELNVGYSNVWDNGFSLGVSTNFGAFKDEITFLPEEVRAAFPGTAQNSILGQSQTAIFGYRTDGLFQSQADVDSHPTGGVQTGNARPGGIKIVDVDNNGVIDSNDRDFIGNTLPDLEYGIRLDVGYKNFDFSVFGSGVAGRIGVDSYIFWNNFVQGRDNAGLGVLNAWNPQNTSSTIPSLSLVNNFTDTSDYIFRNNSYFKIRNLQVGYSLPTDIIGKMAGMTGLRIYLQGENLFWFTPKGYIGADPERIDVNRIPVPTVYSVGLNINF